MRLVGCVVFFALLMATTAYGQGIRVREHVPPMFEFDYVGEFQNGLAVVHRGSEVAVVDTRGGFVIPFRLDQRFFSDVGFSGGVIALYDAESSRFGFYDERGEQAIDYRFLDARAFSEGLAAVQFDAVLWGFIDIAGDVVIPPSFLDARGFREGLAAVFHGRGWGFVDAGGRMVVYPEYAEVSDFDGGYATVFVWETDAFGFIDAYGNNVAWDVVVEPRSVFVPDFGDGLAAFSDGAYWGFSDRYGNVVVAARFDAVTGFSEGYAWVLQDGLWGILQIYERSVFVVVVVIGVVVVAVGVVLWFFRRKLTNTLKSLSLRA